MRTIKLIGALVAVLAFSAAALATSASAAETLWKWLPGSAGETFKGEQPAEGLLQLVGGSRITCAKAKVLFTDEALKASSELLKEGTTEGKDATLELVMIHFEGCKAEGLLGANSLGDEKEVILVHLEIHNCMIAPGRFGLLILPLPVHIEIPAAGLLILVLEKGLFIAELKENGSKFKYQLVAKQTSGKQEIEKCEGGEKETLLAKVDAKEEEAAGLDTVTNLEFDGTKDKEGEAMMEK